MKNCPDVDGPLSLECPSCRGFGCEWCGDSGEIELTSCVRAQVPAWAWRTLTWAIRAEDKGLLPVAGGGLDQTSGFLAAWDYVAGELAAARREAAELEARQRRRHG